MYNDSKFAHVNENFQKMFHLSHDDFLEELLHNFTLFFCRIYHYKCDRLYFSHFKYQIKVHLSRRFIFGHAFWCQRKGILNCQCDKCVKTFQWHSESKGYLWYSRDYNDYFRHNEAVFSVDSYTFLSDMLNVNKKYNYFENVYTPTQLINLFGVVACRIYLNLGKKHFFVGKLKNNSYQYAHYSKQTKKLFDFVCNNINYRYADYAVYNYKPFIMILLF